MKRGFILILEIAALIVILQSSFVQYFLSDAQDSVTEWLITLANYQENRELESLRSNTQVAFSALNKGQKDYLFDVTANRDNVQRFHRLYCIEGDKNPYVYGSTLSYFCSEISRSKVLKTS